jgi:hypothetical protein
MALLIGEKNMKVVTEKYCDKCLEQFRDWLGFVDDCWHLDFKGLKDEVEFYWKCFGIESDEKLDAGAQQLKQNVRDFVKFAHDLWVNRIV